MLMFEHSVDGIIAQLDESDPSIKSSALQALNMPEIINYHWAEVAEQLPKIEALSEDGSFTDAASASLLASKLFFHLGAYEEALDHALNAGDLFDINDTSDYTRKMTEQCVDSYQVYKQRLSSQEAVPEPNPRLVEIVVGMFEQAVEAGSLKNALGIAIDVERPDLIENLIANAPGSAKAKVLDHLFELCVHVVKNRRFRAELLNLCVQMYMQEDRSSQNYDTICRGLFYLDRPEEVANILMGLVDSNEDDEELIAYQTCFDLVGYQNKRFCFDIVEKLPAPPRAPDEASGATPGGPPVSSTAASSPADASKTDGDGDTSMAEGVTGQETGSNEAPSHSDARMAKFTRVRDILTGNVLIPLHLKFLYRNNKSDLVILKRIKESVSERKSVLNNGIIWANGMMHCGTTIDQFLRDNLDWMARAQHWAKFITVASLGMIHARHIEESRTILERYLPGSGGGPYQEGGALYALGLIHVGDNNRETRNYLLEQLDGASNEILQHGACLGLGLTCLGDYDEEATESIRRILFQDRASPGEAAGLAMGMIMAGGGTNSRWYDDMISYAHETQHEKIIRGLSLGIAIMNYGCETDAEQVIDEMLRDKDENIRYGGCYTIGMAYACTGSNVGLRKLLHVAVSDVSNDVRRAAVTNVGFVLANAPEQVPKVVQLLATSYNPYVRYGAAAAIAIACAGSGDAHAMRLLSKLIEDNEAFVRQGALIACGMMLMQQNEKENAKVGEIREKYLKIVRNKHEATMSQLGAIMGTGLIDACGRNATVSLMTSGASREKKMTSIIGMALFWQYWHWFPLVPMCTLMFEPTMVMGLNRNLEMPKMGFLSSARSDKFDYVEPIKEEEKEKEKKLEKAVLSITAKQKARQAMKEKEKQQQEQGGNSATEEKGNGADGDGDVEMADGSSEEKNDGAATEEKNEDGGDASAEAKEAEQVVTDFSILSNPSRVTPNQREHVSCEDERWEPIRMNRKEKGKCYGVVIVTDKKPHEEVELVADLKPEAGGIYGNEAPVPKPFLYLGD